MAIKDSAAIFGLIQAPVPVHSGRPQIEKVYTYRDAAGKALFDVVRFKPKDFRVRHVEGQDVDDHPKYVWNMGSAAPVLYNLPGLLKADRRFPVFVSEGEKDVHAILACGLPATCTPGGAGKSGRVADLSALAKRTVIILAHPDGPGLLHAHQIKERLEQNQPSFSLLSAESSGSVHIVNLKACYDFEGKDVFDWVQSRAPSGVDVRDFNPVEVATAGTWQAEICQELLCLAARARDGEITEPEKPKKGEEVTPVGRSADGGSMAEVVTRKVEWLWPDKIALGKLTIIAGDPGTGKSFLTLDMAARCSAGLPWPLCGEGHRERFGVVLLNAEDDLGDTIRPRLEAAGAALECISYLSGVKDRQVGGEETEYQFDLSKDVDVLEKFIASVPNCKLVVIDPISAYMGGKDSHNNAAVRALLSPLTDLAMRRGVAVVAVSHLRKASGPAIHRTMGSLGFVAAARCVHLVGKDPKDETGAARFMCPVKSNVSADNSGVSYRLQQEPGESVPHVVWDSVAMTVPLEALVNLEPPDPEKLRLVDEAVDWLAEMFETVQRVNAQEIVVLGEREGFSRSTLRRARVRLGLCVEGHSQEAYWYRSVQTTVGAVAANLFNAP